MDSTITLIKELSTIIVSLIGGLAIIIVAYVNKYHEKKLKLIELEKKEIKKEIDKIKIELETISLFFNYEFYEFLDNNIRRVFNNTKITRFLILFAINGKDTFNTVTVVYEYTKTHLSKGAIKRYVRLPIDEHYQLLLKKVEKEKSIILKSEDLPKDSLLYNIYTSSYEGVMYSKLNFLNRLHIDSNNDLLLYSSYATHNNEPITKEEDLIITVSSNIIKNKTNEIIIK